MQAPEIATVDDLVRVLDEHPQWMEALRGRMLTRELLEQPQQLADFAANTDRRFAELARSLAEFAANTDRRFEAADQRSTELERTLAEFAANTDRRFEAADQRSTELERTLAEFAANTDRRFEAADQRSTDLERTLAEFAANTDRRFEAADQRSTELERTLAEFAANTDRRFEAADQRSTDLEQRLAELARQLAEFAANTDRRFEAADQRSTELERALAEFAANTDRRFTELERQLADSIANTDRQFKQLRTDIGPIKAAHAANSARADADLMAEKQGLTFVAFVERQELWAMVPAFEKSKIPEKELLSFRHADIVIRAAEPDGTECYVAVEASYTANGRDTKRAQRNARFLTRFTGRRADPVVAGLRIDDRIRAAVESGEIAWHELHPQTFEVE